MKKKVELNLNCAINLHQGIDVFTSEIYKRIIKSSDFDFHGSAFLWKHDQVKKVKRFKMDIKTIPIPPKYIFTSKYAKYNIIKNYNILTHSKSDIYVFTGNDLPKGKMKIEGKILCVIHDVIPLYRAWEDEKKAEIFYTDKLWETKKADRIIAVSEYTKKELIKYFGCPEEKIDVVYNGVEFDRFNADIDEISLKKCREKYLLPNKFIFYMGSAGEYKNIEGILKAYAMLPDSMKETCGVVIANTRPDLEKLAESLGIQEKVVFLNGIDETDKVAIYKLSYFVMQISLYEGFGIPLIEAMASGRPVIASTRTCLPEVVGNAGILVDPMNSNEISKAMMKLLTNKEEYNNYVKRGIERAKIFSWENAAQQFLNVLKKMD